MQSKCEKHINRFSAFAALFITKRETYTFFFLTKFKALGFISGVDPS